MLLPAAEVRGVYQARTAFVRPFHEGSLLHGLLGRSLRGGPLYERLFAPRVPAARPLLREGASAPPALMPLLAPRTSGSSPCAGGASPGSAASATR